MPLVPAKCTQCGANIEIDDTKEAGICQHCGTAFITEKAINNYVINNTYNIQSANIVMPEKNVENLKSLGDDEYKNKRYEKAVDYYNKILEINGSDKECIFRRYLCVTNLTESGYNLNVMKEQLTTYCRFIDDSQINAQEKNESIVWAIGECVSIIVDEYARERDSNLFDGKIRTSSNHFGLVLCCDVAFNSYLAILDIILCYLEKYEKVKVEYKTICVFAEMVLKTKSKKYSCLSDNRLYGMSESGATNLYEQSDKLLEYVNKVDGEYKLNESIVSPAKGGKGCVNSGGCYIATCVYGSYDCPQVWTLRRFRDYTLDEIWYGRAFIKCYYAISPTLVKWFGETKWFKTFWKSKLDKMVADLNNKGVEDTHYNDKY